MSTHAVKELSRRIRKLASDLAAIAVEVDELVRLVEAAQAEPKRIYPRRINGATGIDAAQAYLEAVRIAGGYRGLARELGLTKEATRKWHVCPPHHAVAVSRVTGVPRCRLCPDLFTDMT